MPKLTLMFEEKTVKEVPVGARPVGIGRSPDNDLPVDNLAVSNYHARVYVEAGRLVVEDLDSLNGTFVNDMRVERATLHDGDSIHIGKHHIKVDATGEAPVPDDAGRKANAPRINETMVLDTKVRREMLQQAAADGRENAICFRAIEGSHAGGVGRQNRPEGICADQQVYGHRQIKYGHRAAQGLVQAQDGGADQSARRRLSTSAPATKFLRSTAAPIHGPVRLNDGDVIAVCGVRLNFIFRD